MDIRANVRDKRKPGWYHIDNEIYDIGLSCEALAIYNAIARYANNETENAYFSGKRWKKLHRVGHGKLVSGLRELMAHNLIAPTGEVTKVGAAYFELCNIDHLKAGKYSGTGSPSKHVGVLPQNRGCAKAEQGGVPPKNINKTNKTIQENHTDNIDMTPKTYEAKKPKKTIQLQPSDKELAKPIYEILDNSSFKVEHSKALTQKIVRAIKKHGLEKMKSATAARCAYQALNGKDLYIHYFMCDDESIEWQSRGAGAVVSKYESTLPEFGKGEIWYAES